MCLSFPLDLITRPTQKQFITPEFQDFYKDIYKALCYDYKKAKSLEETDVCYATIHSWLYSFKVVTEGVIYVFDN
jgi:hypothetical protein